MGVYQAVDGVDEVRLLAERVSAARSDADLKREFGRAALTVEQGGAGAFRAMAAGPMGLTRPATSM